jgi:hypothetical protein
MKWYGRNLSASFMRISPNLAVYINAMIANQEKYMDQMTEQLIDRISSANRRFKESDRIMKSVVESFPACLFANDVLGEAVFLRTADGETIKILDETFPIPATKTMRFCMKKEQERAVLRLSLCDNGTRIATEYVISNVPKSSSEKRIIELKIEVDSEKNVSFHVQDPLTITQDCPDHNLTASAETSD